MLEGIEKAALAIAYDNNMIGNTSLGGDSKERFLRKAEEAVDALGSRVCKTSINAWLLSLTDNELQKVCCGEYNEMEALVKKSPNPEQTDLLLNTIFNV